LFAKAVMRFEVERRPRKLASSVVALSLTPLWSVMSEWEVATRLGAEVRPEVVETEEGTGKACVRDRESERGSAGAGAEELPEKV
jgi:hypothetical protein